MNYPNVGITIITYNRPKEFRQVWQSIQNHVIYPKDKLFYVIGDDGSHEDYLPTGDNITIIRNKRLGMGGNWNSVIHHAEMKAEFNLLLQDDWLFTAPVDLQLGVKFLEHNPDYGMLRYHKLTGHVGLPAVVKEWDTRQAFHGYFHSNNEYVPEMLPFMELLPPFDNSDTYSPYSGGVHLRHYRFTQYYGEYPEGAGFSDSEMEYMKRVNHALRFNLQAGVRHRVAQFPAYFESRFKDLCIGKSYRNTAIEKETIK